MLTLYGHIETAEQRTIIQQYGDWYTVTRYSEEGPGWAAAPPSLLAVPNVTVHPSMASVPTSYYYAPHLVKEALIEIGCVVTSLVVGWLVVTRVHCGQTVHPRPIVTMEH